MTKLKNQLRRLLALMLACFLMPIVVRGGLAQTPVAPVTIAFVNPGKHDEFFWPAVTAVMQAAANQFGFQLEVGYAERDAQTMIDMGQKIIARADPPDFLVLVNEFQAAGQLLPLADAKGIKTFMLLNSFYGQQATEMGRPGERYRNWIGSIVPDNRSAGRRMGTALADCARGIGAVGDDGKYHILALLGDSTTPASIERTSGMDDAVAANPDVVLDRRFNTNWQTPKGHDLTANYLDWAARHAVRPAGIWAANDAVAIGAIQASEERKLQPGRDLCVVGLNWSPEGLALVRDGKLAMTDGGHFLAGGWAMVMIHDYLVRGGKVPAGAATFEMEPVDAGNVERFEAELGQRDWTRIDFKRFARAGPDIAPGVDPGAASGTDNAYDFSLRQILDNLKPASSGMTGN